ncbi:MAG: thiamine biosynthesis protein ThiJ [Pasteurellales bacterium]|nr:MAG: thiamine biosynthesis protein ThiJ [Pasteurellales bacterium]
MKIAYILFDEITLLDFIGIYDPVNRLNTMDLKENVEFDLCAMTSSITDNFGLEIVIDKIKPNLSSYDMIIIAGGFGTRKLQFDTEFIDWIKTASKTKYKVSICTGSLILGAAGFLKNRTATTHFNEYETLRKYCNNVVENRIVDDNDVITSGAVSASIDLGLYICKKLCGDSVCEKIRKSMDYYPSEFEILRI